MFAITTGDTEGTTRVGGIRCFALGLAFLFGFEEGLSVTFNAGMVNRDTLTVLSFTLKTTILSTVEALEPSTRFGSIGR